MFGDGIRNRRIEKGWSIRNLAATLEIDATLLSRFEHEQRIPKKELVIKLAEVLEMDSTELIKTWLSDKVFNILDDYPAMAPDVLQVMESRVEYLSGPKSLVLPKLPASIKSSLIEIDILWKKWNSKKPTSGIQFEKLNEVIGVDYTFESNRIEGNTLTLQETYLVIQEGLTVSGKSIQEHLEAINHDEAIEFVRDLAGNKLELTEYKLKQIHNLILKGIDRKHAGVYRGVPVRIGGSKHIPPEAYLLNKLMEDYFIHYKEQKDKLHPVLLAAEMHERLVSIHPFIDGNGRTSRLIMNLILLRHGYTIANLKGDNSSRLKYYEALEKVQVDNDPNPFYELICKEVKSSLLAHLKLV